MTTQSNSTLIPTSFDLPYESCISDCFAKMGSETREFVLQTIDIEINNLITNNNLDFDKFKLILNEIRDALDGDDSAEGLNQFVTLVNNVKILMDNSLNSQDIINIINKTKISNININTIINNDVFIQGITNNTNIISSFVNNSISTIVNYLVDDSSTNTEVRNQFISAINQLIITQISQVKKEINVNVNLLRKNINNQITQINNDITNINVNISSNKVGLGDLEIQIIELKNKLHSIEYSTNIDINNNISIINVRTQISQINNTIIEMENRISQLFTREDFSYACEIACNSFRNALKGK